MNIYNKLYCNGQYNMQIKNSKKKKLNSFLRHNVYFCIQMQPFQRQASENTEIFIIALKNWYNI